MKKGALLLPQSAVAQSQGTYQVAVIGNDHRVSMRTVKPGETVGTMWSLTRASSRVSKCSRRSAKDQGRNSRYAQARTSFRGRKLSYVEVLHQRPIVAMVIAILMVIVGASPSQACPCPVSEHRSTGNSAAGHLCRGGRADPGAIRSHAHRTQINA